MYETGFHLEGAPRGTPGRRGSPGAPGGRGDHPIAPTEKPLRYRSARSAPRRRPFERWWPAAYGPREGGPGPADNVGERRLPQGGSPQESWYQDWPAANDPQTPTVPGTQRSPGFGHPSARRGPAPSVIKPVKAARGRTATRLRWATCPRSRGGGHARSEPNAPPVTERQPAWQGRRKDGRPKSTQPSPTKAPGGTPEGRRPS